MIVSKRPKCFIGILCLLLIFTYSMPAMAKNTVEKTHWAAQTINSWNEKGLLKTNEDISILPDQLVTRSELIALINNVFGYGDTISTEFVDIPDNAWYRKDIEKAVNAGYLKGIINSKGQLEAGAEQKVTRQEAITLISKAFDFQNSAADQNSLMKFVDYKKIAPYAYDFLTYAVNKGFISGFPDKTLKPGNQITFAEVLTILDNISGEIITKEGTYSTLYKKNVVVNTDKVILTNTTIQGDLYLTEGIGEGEVTLDHVTITGNIYVRGGGENSIKLNDSTIEGKLKVAKQNGKVRILTTGSTHIPSGELYSGAIIQSDNGNIDNIMVVNNAADHLIKLAGNYKKVELASINTKVNLTSGKIDLLNVINPLSTPNKLQYILILDKGTTISQMNIRAGINLSGEGEINYAKVEVNNVTFENTPKQLELLEGITPTIKNTQPNTGAVVGGASGGGSAGNGGGGSGSSGGGSESIIDPDEADVLQAKSALLLEVDTKNVKNNLVLPSTGLNETGISWNSSNPEVLQANGTISRPGLGEPDVSVLLTATIAKGDFSVNKQFELIIKAKQQIEMDEDNRLAIQEAKLELTLGDTSEITQDVILPTKTQNGVSIVWISQNPEVVSEIGHIYRLQSADREAVLTATFIKGNIQDTKDFVIIVKSVLFDTISSDLLAAKDALDLGDTSSVTADVYLPTKGLNNTLITWHSDNTNVISANGKVTRPEFGESDVNVTLTAMISKEEVLISKVFNVTVKAKPEGSLKSFVFNGYIASIDNSKGQANLLLPKATKLENGIANFVITNGTLAIDGLPITEGQAIKLQSRQEITITEEGKEVNSYLLIVEVLESGLPAVIINTEANQAILDKENKIDAAMKIVDGSTQAYGVGLYDGDITIKGRGNSSWNMPKKSYAVSITNSAPILDMPKDEDWVLIANYADKTLLRNYTAYNLGEMIGMKYSPRMRYVDLFLNGEYLGNYLLGEKIDISKSRLNINKLSANDTSGESITGGYLIEKDWLDRLDVDDNYFHTTRINGENVFAIKKPKSSKINAQQLSYISSYFEEAEQALYSDHFTDITTGYSNYFDVDSIIDWYLVNEIFKNADAAFGTSVYFYKDKGGKLSMGPLWDFDIGAGNINYADCDVPEQFYIKNAEWISRFFEDPKFVQRVKERWTEIKGNQLPDMFGLINQTSLTLELSQRYNFEKWPVLGADIWPNPDGWQDRITYVSEVEYLINWLTKRIKWLDEAFAKL